MKLISKLVSQHRLRLKVTKCGFAKDEVNLLGHIVNGEVMALTPDK